MINITKREIHILRPPSRIPDPAIQVPSRCICQGEESWKQRTNFRRNRFPGFCCQDTLVVFRAGIPLASEAKYFLCVSQRTITQISTARGRTTSCQRNDYYRGVSQSHIQPSEPKLHLYKSLSANGPRPPHVIPPRRAGIWPGNRSPFLWDILAWQPLMAAHYKTLGVWSGSLWRLYIPHPSFLHPRWSVSLYCRSGNLFMN